ncbi:glycine cleavage system aminomethyltransferase GcvT [Kyrpidia tusciae]|uniref:aminomethyltransferase n=1 Tax=Kyrpidia tusciae (strain DSM 2912 / NBRC 15312 / T2) TaxID=562970 RepID=D5WRU6_KYRT2|nr:glycine cleavage system aminomethyltransferase GcvT [Kyrpidia tusciae]ADG06898.1 glycine cleavage system T protein [Kyrpidia tusciae DSM 2912]
MTLVRTTPYYPHHVALGAKMMEKGGWIRPAVYTSVEEEVRNTRTNVGIIDVHSMGKFEVIGREAYLLMQYAMTNDLRRIGKGRQGIYTCLCKDDGGIVDDVIVYYLDNELFYLITNTLSREKVGRWLADMRDRLAVDAHVIDVTSSTAYLAVQGPKSADVVAELLGDGIRALSYFEMAEFRLSDSPVLLTRTGYTGELGYELHFPSEYAFWMWECVTEAGRGYGMRPVGGFAIQTLRAEKAYRAYGTDMDANTNPFEAGLGWTVRLDKGDFAGKSALADIQHRGVTRRLTGFRLDLAAGSLPEKGTALRCEGRTAGYLTTVCASPTLGCVIAMGYVGAEFFRTERFEIGDANGGFAFVTEMPFYDPKGERVRMRCARVER